METLISVVSILMSLGAEKSLFRLYHDYKTEDSKKQFLATVTWFIYALALLMLVVLFVLHAYVGRIYATISFSPYYAYALGVSFCMAFEVAPRVYLQVTTQSRNYLFLSLTQMTFSAVAILYFVVYKHQEAEGMLKGMLFAQAGMLPFYIGIHIKNFNVRPNFSMVSSVLKYCLPLLPSAVASWIIVMSSQIFVERNFSTSEVAVYALALKIVGVIMVFASALFTAYKPMFYQYANSENQQIAKKKLQESQNNIILVLIVVAGLIAVFSKDIITIFFREEYNNAIYLIPILMLGSVMGKISAYTNLAFFQEKKTMQIMWIMIATSIVSITMNYIIIPQYSIFGAAFSYLVSAAIFFGLKYVMSHSYYFIPYNWKKMIFCVCGLVVLYLLNICLLPIGVFPFVIKVIFVGFVLLYICKKTTVLSDLIHNF